MVSEIVEWNIWQNKDYIEIKKAKDIEYISPKEIVSYSENQYNSPTFIFSRFSKDGEYEWLKVQNLTKKKSTYVLADHLLFPYKGKYTRSTSSGAAAHSGKKKLLPHAIFELIERDAFMIYWLNKLDMPYLDIYSFPEELLSRVLQLEKLGYEIILKDIGLDINPVIFASARDKEGNYLTCGISSGNNLENMINSALSEVEVSVLHLINLEKKEILRLDPEEVSSLAEHELLHQQEKYKNQTDFFFVKNNKITFDQIKLKLSKTTIDKKVESLGFEIFELDASNWSTNILLPEFRHVSRVLIPGLVPLSYGYGNEPLGMKRIYQIPKMLKLKKIDLRVDQINTFPHPFN